MIVTTLELARDSELVLDRVIQSGEVVEVQRDGETIAEIDRAYTLNMPCAQATV